MQITIIEKLLIADYHFVGVLMGKTGEIYTLKTNLVWPVSKHLQGLHTWKNLK